MADHRGAVPLVRRSLLRSLPIAVVAASASVGYLYGWGSQLTPGAVDPRTFWIGNLAAPYLALPFLAGVAAAFCTCRVASIAGAAAPAAAVCGFYELHLVGTGRGSGDDPGLTAYGRWFSTFLFGIPGGMPWLTAAIFLGAGLGLLGAAWVRSGRWLLAAPIAAAFLLEPLLTVTAWHAFLEWRLGVERTPYALDAANLIIWSAEMAVGTLLIVAAILLSRRRAHAPPR